MWVRISLWSFFISLLSLTLLSAGVMIPGLSSGFVFYIGVVTFGVLGFVASILSNFFDPRRKKINTTKSLLFYVGMILVFAGLMFRFLHWPYSKHLLFAGIAVSAVSFFIRQSKQKEEDELLDSDL